MNCVKNQINFQGFGEQDVQAISNKSFIIICPVRPNSNEHLNLIFTLVL